ncbi:MAG: HupE/UreJ family protein [Burkholderiales bacterium]
MLAGLAHPVSGLDHVIAMLAVGVWASQLGRQALWLLPATFVLVMALGGALGAIGIALAGVEAGIVASAFALCALVACAARPLPGIAAALVAVFAVFHGHAHGAELPESASAFAYSLGFVTTTFLLHLSGIALGAASRAYLARRRAEESDLAPGLEHHHRHRV